MELLDAVIDALTTPTGLVALLIGGVAAVLVVRVHLRRRRRQSWHAHLVQADGFEPLTDAALRRTLREHAGELFQAYRRRPKVRVGDAFLAQHEGRRVVIADVTMIGELHVPANQRQKTLVLVDELPVTLPAIDARPVDSLSQAVTAAWRARANAGSEAGHDLQMVEGEDERASEIVREQVGRWSAQYGPLTLIGRDRWLLLASGRGRFHPMQIRGLLVELDALIDRLGGHEAEAS